MDPLSKILGAAPGLTPMVVTRELPYSAVRFGAINIMRHKLQKSLKLLTEFLGNIAMQVRPTAEAKSKTAISAETTKEHVEAEVNKAKAATNKRHQQRYKSKEKSKAQAQEPAKSKTKNTGTSERASKDQKSKNKSGGESKKTNKKEKKRASGGTGSAANGEAAAQ